MDSHTQGQISVFFGTPNTAPSPARRCESVQGLGPYLDPLTGSRIPMAARRCRHTTRSAAIATAKTNTCTAWWLCLSCRLPILWLVLGVWIVSCASFRSAWKARTVRWGVLLPFVLCDLPNAQQPFGAVSLASFDLWQGEVLDSSVVDQPGGNGFSMPSLPGLGFRAWASWACGFGVWVLGLQSFRV